ncbi:MULTISPECIES: hypothetical protein [Comamonas]|uniref:Uncharacterized protein n=1 Tax=Comamonas testosteroni TaxID=285 RepID=A0A096FJN6_COMTE|nr:MULTISPECIES: hypothetical protein [Comamonas]KGH30556.1 hypothetical protein P353_09895 [Comamonas testosteroni]
MDSAKDLLLAQLAALATACTQRLTQRAQHREKQAARSNRPAT